MKNKYLDAVAETLGSKRLKAKILPELETHIEDKLEYYSGLGYDEAEAERLALEDMGDPEEAAVPLKSLHNRHWYSPFNILFMLYLLVLLYCSYALSGGDLYYSASAHSLHADLFSTFFAVTLALWLIAAQRRKSKLVAIFLTAFMLLAAVLYIFRTQVFSLGVNPSAIYSSYAGEDAPALLKPPFSVLINYTDVFPYLFQPFLYPFAMIFMHGIPAYIDSIFGYGIVPADIGAVLDTGAKLVSIIFTLWAVLLLLRLLLEERLKPARHLKLPIKVISVAVAAVCAFNVIVNATGTAFALVNLDAKRAENLATRQELTEYITGLKLDRDGSDKKLRKKLVNDFKQSDVFKRGFMPYETYTEFLEYTESMLSQTDSRMIRCHYIKDNISYDIDVTSLGKNSSYIMLTYELMYSPNGIISNETERSLEELSGFDEGMTLEEFLQQPTAYQAVSVRHILEPYYKNSEFKRFKDMVTFDFNFKQENTDRVLPYYGSTASIVFENGRLTSNDAQMYTKSLNAINDFPRY